MFVVPLFAREVAPPVQGHRLYLLDFCQLHVLEIF